MGVANTSENTSEAKIAPLSMRRQKAKKGDLARVALEQRAQALLHRINGTLAKIETRMARLSSPAELKKLEQDHTSLRLRASAIVEALKDGSPDLLHHLHEEHEHGGHEEEHCHHVTLEMQALHGVASDEQQALYLYDRHDVPRTGFTAHDGADRAAVVNPQVMLGGIMDVAQAVAMHLVPNARVAL